MKKALRFIFLITIMACLCSCTNTFVGHDGLIEKAREEIPLADIENMDIRIAGSIEANDACLVWFVTGNDYQKHSYFPMEFQISQDDPAKFTFVQAYDAYDRGLDIAVCPWNGYAFLINNTSCEKLVLTFSDGSIEEIEVTGHYPFIYHTTLTPMHYQFFDQDGNEIL